MLLYFLKHSRCHTNRFYFWLMLFLVCVKEEILVLDSDAYVPVILLAPMRWESNSSLMVESNQEAISLSYRLNELKKDFKWVCLLYLQQIEVEHLGLPKCNQWDHNVLRWKKFDLPTRQNWCHLTSQRHGKETDESWIKKKWFHLLKILNESSYQLKDQRQPLLRKDYVVRTNNQRLILKPLPNILFDISWSTIVATPLISSNIM